MGDLSAHFNRSEFVCKHCGCGGPTPQLITILENLRKIRGGAPLRIVSGFRCQPYNDSAAVGGAHDSRHKHADAADIPAGYATLDQARAAGAVGVGVSGQWAVHVDWRPGPFTTWRY